MKQLNKNILFLSLFLMTMVSCQKELIFDQATVAPQLVLNSLAKNDSLLKVTLSQSRFFLDTTKIFKAYNKGIVNLFVNGTFKEKMKKVNDNGGYLSTYVVKANDALRLEVETPDFGKTIATETVIEAPMLLSCDTASTIIKEVNSDGSTYTYEVLNIKLKLKDTAPKTDNYYYLYVLREKYDDQGNPVPIWPTVITNFKDPIFGNRVESDSQQPFETFVSNLLPSVFSDILFDGKTYTLNVNVKLPETVKSEDPNVKIPKYYYIYTVTLSQLSPNLYFYALSLATQGRNVGMELFSEAVQVYSNIENGMGLFGSTSIWSKSYKFVR